MKKLILSTLSLGLLVGCASNTSGYTTAIDNGSQTAVSSENMTITNQDIYEALMDDYGANYVLNKALQAISSDYEVDEEALQKELESTISSYKVFYGDDLDTYAKNNLGYDTFEQYKNEIMIPSLRTQQMLRNYADENFDTLSKQYHFKKLRMIKVATEQEAISLISKLSDEEITFEDAIKENSELNTTNGDLGIVSDLTSTSKVDQAILTLLPQFEVKGLYSVPVGLSDGKYAVLEILETDIEAMQGDILTILRGSDQVMTEAEVYYLNEHNFTVYEKALEEKIKAANPDYIK